MDAANQRYNIPVSADRLFHWCFNASCDVTSYAHSSPSHLLICPLKGAFYVSMHLSPPPDPAFFVHKKHLWIESQNVIAWQFRLPLETLSPDSLCCRITFILIWQVFAHLMGCTSNYTQHFSRDCMNFMMLTFSKDHVTDLAN